MKQPNSKPTLKQNSYTLFDKNTEAIFYNLKATPIQRMLDFAAAEKAGRIQLGD